MSENKNISLDTSRGTFFYFLLCTAAAIVFRSALPTWFSGISLAILLVRFAGDRELR